MKKNIYIALLSIVVFSCKKQEHQNIPATSNQIDNYMANVKAYLKENLYDSDYNKVDFNNSVLSKQGINWFLRIAFMNTKLSTDFVLLQSDSIGSCVTGKFIHIRRDSSNMQTFNGKISIASFQHIATIKKVTENIAATLSCDVAVEGLNEDACDIIPAYDCSDCLPEVIVVGYLPSAGGGGISYGDYLNLLTLAGGGATGGATGTGGSTSGSNGSGTSGNGTSSGIYSPIAVPPGIPGPPKPSADITINYETSASKPGINVAAYMQAFTLIPDAGAQCAVTIFADLPVDDDPSYIFNAMSGATGHCFLQLTKTNGTQSITQIIGFTASKPLAILGTTVPGKIVDNSLHKYNASLSLSITPAQLQTEINAINAIGSTPNYNIWTNNCVGYALGILNDVRPTNPLAIALSPVPGSAESYQTPQGLYLSLGALRQQNGPDAKNITLGVVSYAHTSYGPGN
jgi:hypothetical protein